MCRALQVEGTASTKGLCWEQAQCVRGTERRPVWLGRRQVRLLSLVGHTGKGHGNELKVADLCLGLVG